MKTKTYGMPSR